MGEPLVLVDSGGANIGSVRYALERLGIDAPLTDDPDRIRAAERVILPGVGAAAAAMRRLEDNGLDRVIPRLTQPVLGICVGMQLLYEHSEEGGVRCLGILPGRVRKFRTNSDLRVPHMGWNRLRPCRPDPLLAGIRDGDHAYFVHSYAAPVDQHTVARCDYGEPFTAMARMGNFCAAQFHPERSAATGRRLLANFAGINEEHHASHPRH